MNFFDGVKQRTVNEATLNFKEFKLGDNDAHISSVEETTAKNGNPMLKIIFVDDEGARIYYHIVDGQYKLSKLKQLYQAFGISIGETDAKKWIGKWGVVVCREGEPYNGKVRMEVDFLKPSSDTNRVEPKNNDGFTDDIPF